MPHRLSGHAALDSLSNLAASLNAGKDKQAGDAFFIPALARDQIESLYRGDWLARKIVDIVPYDCVREWRAWDGEAGAIARVKALESRLNLRRAVQRAMVMGRLYGGGALIIGTRESDPAALAAELRPEALGEGGLAFLHAVSRWQLAVDTIERDPLSPWFGEPKSYQVVAPERGTLTLHPSRVIRFLGAPLADPALMGADLWSDSVLTALYDAIHAVALTTTGATSLMHEAKVDVVTVPNLSEHLSNAATTAQLSARFSYAAAMKSMNNLLLLGDGETWARQRVDFAGLPEMVRTFLQVAAGAADIPVTRLLGQSPAGLSATDDGGKPAEDGADATGITMPGGGAGLRGWLSGLYGKLPGPGRTLSASSLPVVLASDHAAVPVTIGKTATAGDGAIATGGTAQALFAGSTPANGWKVANPDPAEDLWVSDSATAAPNGQGSYRLPPGGILTTEPGEKPCGPVSVYGATTGHLITARSW